MTASLSSSLENGHVNFGTAKPAPFNVIWRFVPLHLRLWLLSLSAVTHSITIIIFFVITTITRPFCTQSADLKQIPHGSIVSTLQFLHSSCISEHSQNRFFFFFLTKATWKGNLLASAYW